MTQPEARAFAAWRGMRLLEPGEWLWCAMGPNRWSYPWGTTAQDSVANTLELDLERPTPVGTFESGRTPAGCYDMLGNVAEWVGSPMPSIERVPGDERQSAVGGSFRARRSPIYQKMTFLTTDLHPSSRLDHVGLRCCVEAEAYLWARAPEWGEDEPTLQRLVAVGRRWGRQASPLLQDLAARPGAPRGLRALAEGARL
jgi:formylglycine-generating enzyme required for sulfatase activity